MSLMIGCLAEAIARSLDFDSNELEDAAGSRATKPRRCCARKHPDALFVPPSIAIATT